MHDWPRTVCCWKAPDARARQERCHMLSGCRSVLGRLALGSTLDLFKIFSCYQNLAKTSNHTQHTPNAVGHTTTTTTSSSS
eukprot:2011722-Amphidinium_carterae.1